VLFEIATNLPGFTIDEKAEELGTHLVLPPWLESMRNEIEKVLPPVRLPVKEKRRQQQEVLNKQQQ
jgi:glyoxalase family protein